MFTVWWAQVRDMSHIQVTRRLSSLVVTVEYGLNELVHPLNTPLMSAKLSSGKGSLYQQ